jgi:hypothetical protein
LTVTVISYTSSKPDWKSPRVNDEESQDTIPQERQSFNHMSNSAVMSIFHVHFSRIYASCFVRKRRSSLVFSHDVLFFQEFLPRGEGRIFFEILVPPSLSFSDTAAKERWRSFSGIFPGETLGC